MREKPPGAAPAGVRVRCVGCGDAFGSGGRLQSAWAIEHDGHLYMLDFGATALIGLVRHGVDFARIEAVILSHYHGDHFGGLPFLIRHRQLERVDTPLAIAGPPGLAGRLEAALDAFFPPCRPGDAARLADLREIADGEAAQVGAIRITGFPAVHRPETNPMSLRLEVGGVTIGYSGDSSWCEGVEAAGRDADLFIVEAYRHEPVRSHMSVSELRERLPHLGCQTVVLTHMGRDVLDEPPRIPGCLLAHDGMELVVGRA